MEITEQIPLRVAIQGVAGSYHELAAQKYFGKHIEASMCDSFPALFRSMRNGTTFGVLAIENSVAGTILPNYALIRNSDFVIVGEVYLRIAHQLMALPGQQIEDIREVHSHPMALLQCQHFLEQYPHIRLVESADTAGSADWLAKNQKKGIAAIASKRAAELFQLQIMAEEIEDNKRNFTRFLVISPPGLAAPFIANRNKATLCFSLAHEVGSLAQVLLVLSSHGLNLSKIQSLPVVGREWEYFFHIDLEFDSFEQYQRGLAAIDHQVEHLQSLGEYERGEKPLV